MLVLVWQAKHINQMHCLQNPGLQFPGSNLSPTQATFLSQVEVIKRLSKPRNILLSTSDTALLLWNWEVTSCVNVWKDIQSPDFRHRCQQTYPGIHRPPPPPPPLCSSNSSASYHRVTNLPPPKQLASYRFHDPTPVYLDPCDPHK